MKKHTAAWDAMQKFEITVVSGSDHLFANGRQQVKVQIELVATLNGSPVALNSLELESVRLIEFNTGKVLPQVVGGDVPSGWASNRNHLPQYDFYPVVRRDAAPIKATAASQYCELYVQTSAAVPLKIGVQITRASDGEIFKSSDEPYEYREVTLTPVPVPTKNIANYTWDRTQVVGNSDAEFNLESLDYYVCGVMYRGSPIRFLIFKLEPASICMTDVGMPNQGSYVGYADVGNTLIIYTDAEAGKPSHLDRTPSPGTGTVVLFRGKALTNPVRPNYTTLTGLDSYGNSHTATVGFTNGRRKLILS